MCACYRGLPAVRARQTRCIASTNNASEVRSSPEPTDEFAVRHLVEFDNLAEYQKHIKREADTGRIAGHCLADGHAEAVCRRLLLWRPWALSLRRSFRRSLRRWSVREYAQTLPQPFVKRLNLRCSQLTSVACHWPPVHSESFCMPARTSLQLGTTTLRLRLCLSSHRQPVHKIELAYCVLATCLAAASGAPGAVDAVLLS